MKAALQVIAHLEGRGVRSALIGGAALGVHGIARATLDVDLLVADSVVLQAGFWRRLASLGAPEIRRGDSDDPLGGIVRFGTRAAAVDVLLGKGAWIRHILERRIEVRVRRQRLPVVDRADLVLLKLFAGGPQDLLDINLLLTAHAGELRATVVARLREAPRAVGTRWRELVGR